MPLSRVKSLRCIRTKYITFGDQKMTIPSHSVTLHSDAAAIPTPGLSARVYVIDDESEVRRSIHFLLSTIGIISWPFISASDFLENIENLEPAPILLDIRMPEIDGIQLMTTLQEREINWPIIVITAHGDVRVAVKSIKLGAIEFLEKPFDFVELRTCLQTASERLASIKNVAALKNAARTGLLSLSSREMDVIRLLIRGDTNKAAAYQLSLSVRTIEMHRANALAKLKIKSLAEVVQLLADADLRLADNDGI